MFIFWNIITKKAYSSKFEKKGYQYTVLVSIAATTPVTTADNHNREQIIYIIK